MLVELRDCAFGYGGRPVVRVDRLCLHEGKCLGVFGPNGAGKTTLVRGFTGLLAPLAGTIQRQPGVRFGYLPQHRSMDRHWPMTGLDAASLALSARLRFGWVGRNRATVLNQMRRLEVDDLAPRSFARLSGGQQQRILLAGALASDPQALVLDEPTDGLDVRSRQALLQILREQNRNGLCTVMISHDVEDLLMLCDRVAWLHPPDETGLPSSVEVITSEELAGRVTKVRWMA